ncbi:Uncharacterized protein C18orf19 homolog A,Uncharacterized protein C18orf19 homolog B,Protein FAM210A [Lepeophtheirus salmonis]|uniref:Uncharacterized protein C18orf19 homolog A,Uncharacterized protein C18orf19 homolog B,Protein FAM210A n=1 Tax=Lepeophtheirus salmonis TaxID=72036 RepID=A0A7R8CKJ5_LEPSM|nr:Uncharacterized protein C18orf19 homolog A,Uncharacterized protein C18orf19 homolog B,Protein FAM210A [Lepeophtheirus salmonis]CAF2804280.1 Uncharacterized protein C18orf19 homolog A,Uncharacterized protein C18orf19 homolog B,Protein FAM210A [Lepeophtheirus salmonis]
MRALSTLLFLSKKGAYSPSSRVFLNISTVKAIHPSVVQFDFVAKYSDDSKKSAQSLSQRFKEMWKNYWYVLLPVHVSTSVFWFGSFYFLAKSGVDIAGFLESAGLSQEYIDKLKSSDMGYYALSYACYKVATPARYTLTLAGTTASINYLVGKGYLKTTAQISKDVKHKRNELKEKYSETREEMKDKISEKRGEIIEKVEERRHVLEDRVDELKNG